MLDRPLARIDGWRIRDLRGRSRPRLQELLLDHGCAPDSDLVLVAGRVDTLGEHVTELQLRVAHIEHIPTPVPPAPELAPSAGYVLFVASTAGYTLLEADGPFDPGTHEVILDGRTHAVQRIGRSPLPGDHRRCVFLQPVG